MEGTIPVVGASTFEHKGTHYFVRSLGYEEKIVIQIYKDEKWEDVHVLPV